MALNEGTLTLVNAGQPCLRIIFDLKAELKKKKTDWRLELDLGALQAFGLGREGVRATTLLTRRTWKPIAGAGGAGTMIQIGEVVGRVVVLVVGCCWLLLLFLLFMFVFVFVFVFMFVVVIWCWCWCWC